MNAKDDTFKDNTAEGPRALVCKRCGCTVKMHFACGGCQFNWGAVSLEMILAAFDK